MDNFQRIITATALFLVVFSISGPVNASQQTTTSAWDLIRQARTGETESSTNETPRTERILHFPKERSLGSLEIGEENIKTDAAYPFEEIAWESFGSAQGDVKIPLGKIVRLILNSWTWQNPANLSALEQLKPDDIYSLTLSPIWSLGGNSPEDNCLPYVLHLSGLKTLNLRGANITAKGLESLAGLKSLERLCLPINVNDSSMVAVGKLKTLTLLRTSEENSITNTGLKQLENLKSLRTLHLDSVRMTDEGLKVLSELPNLNYLVLRGNFTNDIGLHLKDVSSLRGIRIDSEQFGDSGIKNLAGITQLENINVYWVRGITDESAGYLKDMTNLKKLDISNSQVTEKGLYYLQECRSIETLILPGTGISDKGLTYIGNMTNLKHLRVLRLAFADPARDVGYYTDKGVAELTKCKLLEELLIGSTGMTDESLSYISELKNLKSLFVNGNGISDEGIKHIAKLTNLKELNVSNHLLTDKAIAELAPLKSLTSLSIGGNAITVSGLIHLNNFKNLKTLDIRKIKQNDSDIMDISGLTELEDLTLFLNLDMNYRDGLLSNVARFRDQDWACLANLSKLKRLQITGFGITDDGMKYLSDLNYLDFLSIQCLYETSITDEGLKYLADKPKLNRLIISDGHFTDKALEYLDGIPALTSLQLTSDFAFSNAAIAQFQRNNPKVVRLQLMP